MKIQHLSVVDEIISCLLLFETKIYIHIMKGLKIHKMGYNLSEKASRNDQLTNVLNAENLQLTPYIYVPRDPM